jgi:hypothetical protein
MTHALNRTFLMALVFALGCGDDDGTTPPRDGGPPRVDGGGGDDDAGGGDEDAGEPVDAGEAPAGMCTNASDMTAVTRTNYGTAMDQSYGDVVTDCAVMCFLDPATMSEPEFSPCARDCVDEDTMMSASNGCRDCYVARAGCAAMNCAIPCLDGGDDCTMCQCENDCVSNFVTCSGLPDDSCDP